MKIFLTGATGFLGSALARRWTAEGHSVTALVRPGSRLHRLAPIVDRLDRVSANDGPSLVEAVVDIQPDAIVHTACSYGRRDEAALTVFDVNLRLGMLLLDAASHCASPVSLINTGTVLAPDVSLYALSKQQFSEWGARIATSAKHRLRFVNVRLQHMYGPNDDPSKFTTHVIHACRDNQPALALTLGEQRRDFIHIDDTVSAYTTILEGLDRFRTADTIDVGTGHAPPLREFVETVHRLTGSKTRLDYGAISYRPTEAMHCQADTSRLQTLGWHPAHSLEAGIRLTLAQEGTTR